tara:strand:- start:2561 stop:2830 length:270 start_codon:yes stop_codon:yes gene_type:complete
MSEDTQPFADHNALRESRLEILRQLRAPKLEELDVLYIRALEESDTEKASKIVALKKKLRDIPDEFEKLEFTEFDALNDYLPDCLNEEV